MAPSTFASAAAGNNHNAPSSRDSTAEWGRRTNGATQTFRRTSGAVPTNSASAMANAQSDGTAPSQPAPRYVPPHRNGTLSDMRYSKDQLLEVFKSQQSTDGGLSDGLPSLYALGWQPDMANGASTTNWARNDHSREAQHGPDVCWERDGMVEPLGLIDMDDDERELFTTSVNTPLKTSSAPARDNQQTNGLPGRKFSVSGTSATPGGLGQPSPSAARGFGRHRDTSDSFQFPSNPLSSPPANRDDQRAPSPPPSLQRRRTDLRDSGKTEDAGRDGDDKSSLAPFGSLKRTTTGPLSAGLGGASQHWATSPQSAGLPPMGSFGNFGLGGQQTASGDKRASIGSGRLESRFKNLLSKDGSEDMPSPTVQRKGSVSSLSRVNENESWRPQMEAGLILPESEEELSSGSAALPAGIELNIPPQLRQGLTGLGSPRRSNTMEDSGFGAFGMTADTSHGFGQGFYQGRDAFHQTPSAQRMGAGGHPNEPMSPTDTNPYRSPEQHAVDQLLEDPEMDETDDANASLPGLGAFGQDASSQLGGLGGLGSMHALGRAPGAQAPASDRSDSTSGAAGRGFAGLGGLGQFGALPGSGAWPSNQAGFGTPSRQAAGLSSAFGGGIFATAPGELQSPGLAGLGGSSLLSSRSGGGFGGAGSGSKMASMFPSAMQEQMRQSEQRADGQDLSTEQSGNPGSYGGLAALQGGPANHIQPEQHVDALQVQLGVPGQQLHQSQDPPTIPPQLEQQIEQIGPPPASAASNQPPPQQQRTMVMPDRMRWIYRDPQGQTQGPWSGLEMHDWYKAGFFSPELLVKKYEDTDYEPLAQLIRRIGNSREPFLVPQIGIPHGPASNNGPTSWAGTSNPTSAGGAQPPFASSFPSFGTTLTADQQNALERRKQEEQYLMARQKEYLAQAQMTQRMQVPSSATAAHQSLGPTGQLHHHSSAQSLHSQPSFSSMTSPNTFQPSPIQGPAGGGQHVPGFFDNSFRSPQASGLSAVGAGVDSLGHIREEQIPGTMDRLSIGNRPAGNQFSAIGEPFATTQQQHPSQQSGLDQHTQQVQQMLQDRARLQQEQAQHEATMQQRPDELALPNDRLQQFQQLQSPTALDTRFQAAITRPAPTAEQQASLIQPAGGHTVDYQQQLRLPQEPMSLTEQVEAAVSAQQSPVPPQSGLPQPFPPAPSQSPLPAPAAQRTGRTSVADQLQTESRDLSQTPSVETPSAAMAPWASAEATRGPSLREIQEAEAKKAAEVEAIAAAARRAAFEKELEAQALAAAAVPQPGLPVGASWGASAGSPATPGSTAAAGTPAAWAKAAQKPSSTSTKTMAQIQKEEEARKRKLAAAVASAQAMSGIPSPAGGKSYANLAGKVTAAPPLNVNVGGTTGAWQTVGAGGKPKTPAAPATATRSVSQGVTAQVRKAPSRSSTLNSASASAVVTAQEEFRKWAVGELRPDLNKGISAEDFVATLAELGTDKDMITEAVHGASNTIDSRHFAEEFLRRKKLADKGMMDLPPKSASPHGGSMNGSGAGGWSEVAKKGPGRQESGGVGAGVGGESNGSFKVVAAKKKSGKR
ncbi:hypothetical protein BAUCODRAFT_34149 [Baudoinia panamericana UAMH 10762]|uniref:GYF domain-containing protein n=1 Tax=Baudoinia panamericana (strain UAMH 10762) TaxID=717646 RepID=M2MJ99_BAUPA|nr:uncharacterized protein BAUCODRAFT_34149 [Baudoinia panamericana UAMH 10762]EMC96756.1 hypothetical protein BAUCODRAFT_34149 [Baudoinia panamericana UAMH 10762]